MKKTIYTTLLLLVPALGFSQQAAINATQSALSGEDLIEKYHSYEGAVLNMTREEWDVFHAWEGYDREAHVRILEDYKAQFSEGREARKQARAARSSECDCWIEPDDTYTQVTTNDWVESGGAGLDVDCFIGPIGLNGWSHNHYGQLFNAFYINSKGTVSFGDGYIDWTPEEFPAATYDQLAAFWADSDFRATGELWYKVTPEAVYVNFIDLGYFNNHDDKMNNFQIIFTPESSELLPEGNNVQFCYLDMQWAHGDVGGSGGFLGPTPANVGCDRSTSSGPHIQFGRFNLNTGAYNGPYGATPQQQDGINWLDNKTFNINTIGGGMQNNVPPIATSAFGCDTLTVCLNDTLDLDIQFLPPETNQQVLITVDVDGDEDGLFTTTLQNGSIASFVGGFVGSEDNVGIHTITVTGTDTGDPAAETTVSIVIEVVPVEVPVLTIEGDLTVCAGSSTILTASDGFESYVWSSGCQTQSCEITGGGQYLVTGFLDVCTADRLVTVESTPYFLPCISIVPNPVCSDEPATVTVCEDEQADYISYEWTENWNGLGGEIFSENGPQAVMSPGTYRLLVENEEGCFGQRVFIVQSIDAFIPDDTWSGAYCDGLEDVTFEGGYSNPAEGQLTMYLFSSDNNGWNGSFVNVYINGEVAEVFTSTSTFLIEQVDIESGDFIEIEYVSSGQGSDGNYSIQLFNCANSNSFTLNDFQDGEIIFSEPAGCTAEPAFGTWTVVSGPDGGTFSDNTQFDTTFSPGDFGLYEICFSEAACGIEYCYELEYTEAPSISLNENEALLCGDETFTFVATVDDLGGTATIDWPAPGEDDVLSNTYGFDEPQTLELTVTVTNGCGSDSEDFTIIAQGIPEPPVVDDAILCDGGSVELVAVENPSSDLIFEWTFNGNVVGTEATFTATETGTYCVNVSNECFPAGLEDCGELTIAGEIPAPFPDFHAECFGGSSVNVNANLPSGDWSIVWPDGSTGTTYVATSNGVVTAEITDPGNCATTEYTTNVYIGVEPTVTPTPTEPVVLCPEVNNTFFLNSPNGVVYSWDIDCNAGITLQGGNELTLVSSQLSQECWGLPLTITGVSENPCGSASAEFEVLIDPCAITIPNIFTPNNDGTNDTFFIEGLDVYNDVQLWVYNRWGNLVYESSEYINSSWRGDDVADGTYWYVLILPNGIEHKGTVNIAR